MQKERSPAVVDLRVAFRAICVSCCIEARAPPRARLPHRQEMLTRSRHDSSVEMAYQQSEAMLSDLRVIR